MKTLYNWRSAWLRRSLALSGLVTVVAVSSAQTQYHFYQLGPTQLGTNQAVAIADHFSLQQEMLPSGAPLPAWTDANGAVRQTFEGGTLYVNPDLTTETKAVPSNALVTRESADFVAQYGLVPQDDSTWTDNTFNYWTRQAATPEHQGALLTPVAGLIFRRTMDGFPCLGPASKLTVDVDSSGVAGVLANIRPVTRLQTVVHPKTDAQILDEYYMYLQMELALNPGTASLQSKFLAYVEQGVNFVQPAWVYNVEITNKAGAKVLDEIIVPLATNSPEALEYNVSTKIPPIIPAVQTTANFLPAINTVNLGEYVVRQDADQGICINIANTFYGNASSAAAGIGQGVYRSQYYWDEQWMWQPSTNQAQYFQGSVDFALVVAHGAPWEFSCLSNYGEYNDLHSLNRYGKSSPTGDYTSYMLFTACDLMPAPGDPYGGDYTSGSPFDVWWNLFDGLHAVYGYRTTAGKQACIDSFGSFATTIGGGHPNVAAWLDATGSLDHSGGWNYGTIVLSSHNEGDTIFNTDKRPAASSLTIWWNHS